MTPENASTGSRHEYLERVDPTRRTDHLAAQHLARYDWAGQFLPARRVLDCSCGLGYGSALLARRGAEFVLGVDISHGAIAYAREHFGGDTVRFVAADALQLVANELGGPFDLIVSLETIEHLTEPERLLDVFASLLTPDGVLVLSCPNDVLLDPGNPYHRWREDRDKLPAWLQARFPAVYEYAEVYTTGVVVAPLSLLAEQPQAVLAATRVLDQLPRDQVAGWLFACSRGAAVRPVGVTSAVLLGDYVYLHKLDAANRWLGAQREQLERAAAQKARELEELNAWCSELNRSNNWLEEQRRAWEQATRESEQRNEELRDWIGQLEQAKAALLEQLARERDVVESLRREVELLRARTEHVR